MADKVTTLNRRLKEVKDKFEEMKKLGLSEDLLVVYIHDKVKLPKRDVKKMLNAQDQFYETLIKKLVSEEI